MHLIVNLNLVRRLSLTLSVQKRGVSVGESVVDESFLGWPEHRVLVQVVCIGYVRQSGWNGWTSTQHVQ